METVLYQIHFKFYWGFIMPAIFTIIILGFLFLLKRNQDLRINMGQRTLKQIFRYTIIFGVSITLFINIFYFANLYYRTKCLENGHYLEVQGYVEDFKPAETGFVGGQSALESFNINGVYFEYMDEAGLTAGYSDVAAKNGVVKENGQYLHIKYVRSGAINVIIYIGALQN